MMPFKHRKWILFRDNVWIFPFEDDYPYKLHFKHEICE